MYIETNRLILREMNEKDFDALYAVLADTDIMHTSLIKSEFRTGL